MRMSQSRVLQWWVWTWMQRLSILSRGLLHFVQFKAQLQVWSVGQIWKHCPRSALRRVLESVTKEFGLTFVIGQELEFYLLREGILDQQSTKKMPDVIDNSLYCRTGAFDNVAALMDDICEAVESFSIPVEQLHAESGPGQFEIAIAPCAGMSTQLQSRSCNGEICYLSYDSLCHVTKSAKADFLQTNGSNSSNISYRWKCSSFQLSIEKNGKLVQLHIPDFLPQQM